MSASSSNPRCAAPFAAIQPSAPDPAQSARQRAEVHRKRRRLDRSVTSVRTKTKTTSRIRFEVNDSGIGMSEDVRAELFEKFSQADNSISRRYRRNGPRACDLQAIGGSDGRRDRRGEPPGSGSTFFFELPLLARQPSLADPTSSLRPSEGRAGTCGRRCQDESRNPLATAARVLGWRSPAARTASTRLPNWSGMASGKPYDIVFLDQMMPGMTGDQLAARIRANPKLAGYQAGDDYFGRHD